MSCPLRYAWQFWALLKRQAFYSWSKKASFILMQVLVPLACMIFLAVQVASATKGIKIDTEKPAIGLDMYHDKPTTVMYLDEPDNNTPVMRTGYEGIDFANVEKFTEDMFATDDVLIGIHIDDSHATAVYTDAGPLAGPAAVNVLTNSLAARLVGRPRAVTTLVDNKYSAEDVYTKGVVFPKNSIPVYLFCSAVVFMAIAQMSGFVALPSAEREAGTRHLLVMGGCPLPLFWAATYVAHVSCCLLAIMLPISILAPALDKDATFNITFIGALFLLVLLALLASCAFNNVISLFRPQGSASNMTIIVATIFGFLGALDKLILEEFIGDAVLYLFVEVSFVLLPAHAALAGAVQAGRACLANAWCARNLHHCPDLFIKSEIANETACCGSTGSPQSYYSIDSKGAGGEMLFLFMQFVAYTALLMILETRIMSRLFGPSKVQPAKSRFTDPAVMAEKQYVEENIKLDRKAITDAILVHDIYKLYVSKGVAFMAVKGLSFSVKKGECFGLLGVNGAGKSTTFKMLNAEERPSRGNIFSSGYFFKQRFSYMSTYSYCGQFQGMDTFLTGRQNLDLVLTMRGFERKDVREETVAWLEVLGLMKYADRRVSTYSGGCSRRLAAAAALCQRAPTTLLDEPTAGVDPVARRCVQAAVVRAKRAGDSVIIASHSMDEMEALCERMVIMSGGQVATLGSAPQLRAQHARGYSAVFKLFPIKGEARAEDTATQDSTQKPAGITGFLHSYISPAAGAGPSGHDQILLDAEMHRRFDCNITDDRKVLIQYHINNLMPYSQLFTQMEQIKSMFPNLIEDYSVTETTLEEVFLSIAKEAIEHKEQMKQKKDVKKREPFFKKWCGKKQ